MSDASAPPVAPWPSWGRSPVPDEEFLGRLREAEARSRDRELLAQAALRLERLSRDHAAALAALRASDERRVAELAQADAVLADVERRRAEAESARVDLAARLADVLSSRTWRTGQRVAAVRARLLP